MGIREIMAADLAATAFDATAAETPVTAITWDPAGDNISCNAIVGSKNISGDYAEGEDHVTTCRVVVQTADIADPQVGKEFTVGSDTWMVVEVERSGYGLAVLQAAMKAPVARAHEGHTKRMV